MANLNNQKIELKEKNAIDKIIDDDVFSISTFNDGEDELLKKKHSLFKSLLEIYGGGQQIKELYTDFINWKRGAFEKIKDQFINWKDEFNKQTSEDNKEVVSIVDFNKDENYINQLHNYNRLMKAVDRPSMVNQNILTLPIHDKSVSNLFYEHAETSCSYHLTFIAGMVMVRCVFAVVFNKLQMIESTILKYSNDQFIQLLNNQDIMISLILNNVSFNSISVGLKPIKRDLKIPVLFLPKFENIPGVNLYLRIDTLLPIHDLKFHYNDGIKMHPITNIPIQIVKNIKMNDGSNLISNKRLYALNGNDYVFNCFVFISFLLTHSGMHAYNGNPGRGRGRGRNISNLNRKVNTIKKDVKELKNVEKKVYKRVVNNTVAKVQKKLKPLPKGVKKYENNQLQLAKMRQGKVNRTRNMTMSFLGITDKAFLFYLDCVRNPIHTNHLCKIPFGSQRSFPWNDNLYLANNITIYSGASTTTNWCWKTNADGSLPAIKGVFIYFVYGANPTQYVELFMNLTPTQNQYSYKLYMIPIQADNGAPLYMYNQAVNSGQQPGIPTFGYNNHDEIWSVSKSLRLVYSGFRVHSNVELNVNQNQQAVQYFYAGQLNTFDFLAWVESGGGDCYSTDQQSIDPYVQKQDVADTYTNKQGAASLYKPFQGVNNVFEFWSFPALYENSVADANGELFTNVKLNFPFIYITFVNTISKTGLTNSGPSPRISWRKHLLYMMKQLRIIHGTRYTITKNDFLNILNNLDDDMEAYHQNKLQFNVANDELKIDELHNLGAVSYSTGQFILPISLQAELGVETLLEDITSLTPTPIPVDCDFQKHCNIMSQENSFPLSADGNSFKGILKKFATPKQIRRNTNFTVGMIKEGRHSLNSIYKAFQ